MTKLTKEGSSFHTFELTKSITYEELREIKNTIYQIASQQKEKVFQDNRNITECIIWKRNGVRLFLHENMGNPPHIRLVVNPRITIEDFEYVGIFSYSQESMEQVRSCIDQILTDIHLNETFESMTLSRIDLCVNIEFEDVWLCGEYMRLFRKCRVPDSYHQDRFYSDEANYKEKNKHSFRARKRDVTFTIYDKLFQLEEESFLNSNSPLPNGLLRIEVALRRNEILRIARERMHEKYSSNLKLFQLFGEESKELMKPTIIAFFPHGVYAPYDILRENIGQIKIKEKVRNRMLYLVEKASQCKSLNNAIKNVTFEKDLSPSQIRGLLEAFEENHMNPVTLPKTGTCLSLPSLREILGYESSAYIPTGDDF